MTKSIEWKEFTEDVIKQINDKSSKPLYKVKLKNGSVYTVFPQNGGLVRDTFDQESVNLNEIISYS